MTIISPVQKKWRLDGKISIPFASTIANGSGSPALPGRE
jgi:hypothetical protein